MRKIAFLFALIALFATASFAQKKNPKLTVQQLGVEANYARPDGKDMVFYIKGSAYSFIPGERPQKLFGVDGFNIRRRVDTAEKDGFFLSTREIVFYTDPKTDEIIDEWTNPWTKEKCEVFHIQNDPVNGRFRVRDGKYISVSMDGKTERGEGAAPQEINDHYVWTSDVFPFYPLPGFDKNYTASEMFDFYVEKDELYKTTPPKNVMISWTRVGPWLPWMKMPKNEGVIIVHARSYRMETFDLLPERIKKLVKEKYPSYMTAPATVDPAKPNETSWTFYNRVMAEWVKKQ
ncbi:MAG: DUF1838 family protein [Acidobacteria bacterium]|nr:DUF1838 family protein [Acidobacteriota bacterium]